jgi:hypothetical protein
MISKMKCYISRDSCNNRYRCLICIWFFCDNVCFCFCFVLFCFVFLCLNRKFRYHWKCIKSWRRTTNIHQHRPSPPLQLHLRHPQMATNHLFLLHILIKSNHFCFFSFPFSYFDIPISISISIELFVHLLRQSFFIFVCISSVKLLTKLVWLDYILIAHT